MTARRVVVFDLGGVLIDWNPRYLFRRRFADEEEMERFLDEVCPPEWNVMQDAGRSIEIAVAERSAKFPDFSDHIVAFYDCWEEMLSGSIASSVAILAKLREAGVPLYALTNWSAETFPIAQRRFEFLDWFAGTVVSGQEGLIKPDPRIYELLLSRFDLRADELVFIDDSPDNVDGAERLGIHGLNFTSARRLENDLRELGLLN